MSVVVSWSRESRRLVVVRQRVLYYYPSRIVCCIPFRRLSVNMRNWTARRVGNSYGRSWCGAVVGGGRKTSLEGLASHGVARDDDGGQDNVAAAAAATTNAQQDACAPRPARNTTAAAVVWTT